MSYDEITHKGWPLFGEHFADHHQGWYVTLVAPGGEVVVRDAPMQSMTIEGHAMTLDCGEPDDHFAHRVANLQRVEIETMADGHTRGVRLITDDGEWMLRLHAAQPEPVRDIFKFL